MSTTTNEQNVRRISTIRTISAAPIWSANAGSSGAGSTSRPDGSCSTSRFRRNADVEAVERADRVDDGVLRRQLEHHGDVAELQVGVDEHDRLLAAAGRG